MRHRPARWRAAAIVLVLSAACSPPPAPPAAAVIRTTPPPWDAERDAISYIRAAGLEELRSGDQVQDRLRARLTVVVDGDDVLVPAFVGIDRVRAIDAPLHTHTSDGVVWVEHPSSAPRLTVGDFFAVWGVRFDRRCVGSACGTVVVTVDGRRLAEAEDPREVVWSAGREVRVEATTS